MDLPATKGPEMPALPTSAQVVCRVCGRTVHPRIAHVCNAHPVGRAS